MDAFVNTLTVGNLASAVLTGVATLAAVALALVVVMVFAGENRRTRRRIANVVRAWETAPADPDAPNLRLAQYDTTLPTLDRMLRYILPRPELLRQRLVRTGLPITIAHYALICVAVGVLVGLTAVALMGMAPSVAFLLGVAGAFALPHFLIGILGARRQKVFTEQFPDAIDLIVRGLRSGLPIIESINAVGREMEKPIGAEFRIIGDAVKFGKTIEEATKDAIPRINTSEYKFFVVALSVQRETGGNLAETLENLSDVLRRRRQMRKRIKAMASEPKASAWILGCLPFIMFGIIYAVNPSYVSQLFTDPRGHTLIAVGLISQSIGVGIMAKMVRFEI